MIFFNQGMLLLGSNHFLICSMLFFFSHFLHQFHEMSIRCIHIFSFVHKILVPAPTIPVPRNNSLFLHLPNQEKKTSFSPCKCLQRLKDNSLQTRGHHRSLRGLLYDFNRSIRSISFQNLITGVPKQYLHFRNFRRLITQNKMIHESRLFQIFIHV